MTTHKKIIYGIAILFLAGLSLFIWNNYQIQIEERYDKPIKLPSQISGECGMKNCHGLNITCGLIDVPPACDKMYAAGDNCRQFASCQIINGQCQLEKTPKFNDCQSCVEKCEFDHKNDPIKIFECESKCADATTPIDLSLNPGYCQNDGDCLAIANPGNGCYYGYFNKNATAAIEKYKNNRQMMIQDCPNFGQVYCDMINNKCTAKRLD